MMIPSLPTSTRPRRARSIRLALALSAGFTVVPAAAQQDGARGSSTDTIARPSSRVPATPAALPSVEITGTAPEETATGPVVGYRARRGGAATKTDTPLAETSQSVTVVTRDQIVDQGANTVQEALGYAAGLRPDAYGLDTRTDNFRIRGGYADEYLDGLRKNFDYYTSSARTDPYALERIEVLRGPAAMLYGQGSTGGIVNMVSKRPQAEAQREIGLQYGSWNRRQLQADATGPVDDEGRWLYRLVGVVRKSDTQVDHVRDDRAMLAPTLTWRPGAATSLTLQALVQSDRTGSTSQFFPWSGMLSPNPDGRLPTHRFIGDPDWDRYDTDRTTLGWLLEHRFDTGWTLVHNLRWQENEVDYRSLYGDSFTVPGDWAGDPVGKRLFGRFADGSITDTRQLTADQHVRGRIETGGVRHDVLAGVDVARYRKSGRSGSALPAYYPGGTVPLIDAYDPTYPDFTPPPFVEFATSRIRQTGVYLQDQVRFGERWLVTAGLRHDRVRNDTEGLDVEKSHATTKRVGVMHLGPGGWSPYLSYSESFTPLANIEGQRFEPLKGKQWELGVKGEIADGGVAVNAAVYDLREENQLAEVIPGVYRQNDETRARGFELEVKGRARRGLDVVANYTYTDLEVPLEAVPMHQVSAWAAWRPSVESLPGLTLGAGVRHMSSFHDGPAPTVPTLTLLDALVAWDTPAWRFALNITNLTDRKYISTCLSRGDCWFGSRRNAVASVTYRW